MHLEEVALLCDGEKTWPLPAVGARPSGVDRPGKGGGPSLDDGHHPDTDGQPRLRKGRTGEAPARWPVPATALSTEQGRHTGETQHSTRSECSGQVPKPLS